MAETMLREDSWWSSSSKNH